MHFSIIVAGDNYEEQLAPFQENNMGDCPNEYLEFYVDGEWIDADWDKNETFAKEFDEWFDNLPDDTTINVIDCHE